MDFLKELGESLKDGNYEGIAPVFTTEKYRMLHIHPQGTIEWRGPRGFMNSEYNIKNVYEFFKLLHKFVMWIGHTLAEFEILGMSRDNYFKLIFNEDYKENELISDFNKKKKEQASIRRLSKMFKDGDSSNLINLIKKSYNKNERNYENYNKCNLIFWLLENNIEKYSKFIKDLFLRTVALKDNKLREEVLKMLSYYGDIFTKGFLTLSFDEMVYCFLMLLNNVNNNSCLYNILTYNLNNETVNEAFNKALRNCTSQKINGETLKQLFYNFDGLEKYGKSINTPDVIDVETLEAQLFSSISNVASTKKEGSSNLFKEEDFKNNDIFHHFIKICLAAHENEVLASILNNLLNKMGIYFGSQNNNIKLKEMEKYCKYLQHIILTGNTNYEFNV